MRRSAPLPRGHAGTCPGAGGSEGAPHRREAAGLGWRGRSRGMRRLRRLFEPQPRPESTVVTEDSSPVLLTSVAPVREAQEPERLPHVPPRSTAASQPSTVPRLPKRSILPPPAEFSESPPRPAFIVLSFSFFFLGGGGGWFVSPEKQHGSCLDRVNAAGHFQTFENFFCNGYSIFI